jgi:hypothetical protein
LRAEIFLFLEFRESAPKRSGHRSNLIQKQDSYNEPKKGSDDGKKIKNPLSQNMAEVNKLQCAQFAPFRTIRFLHTFEAFEAI